MAGSERNGDNPGEQRVQVSPLTVGFVRADGARVRAESSIKKSDASMGGVTSVVRRGRRDRDRRGLIFTVTPSRFVCPFLSP
jgi:hypothetical protein